ncbi:MAG: coenzyme-B sulfoethylthiotransferase subunit gamma [Candidatus Helarchaeota archaeon]|nr:coenzyme-B sulfoethylthiotransferase subunit gamma [Candidatus Helarchaeota archaeon]
MAEKKKVDYTPQIYPGAEAVSERRRKIMDPDRRLLKLRDIPDDDVVILLGHRPPGSLYSSVHPPLDEMVEAYDPIKSLVEPTPGARAGDRMRFVQFTDSFWRPVLAPWLRARLYFNRFRGVDTVIYSGRQILEMRERDVEAATRILVETELFDPARTALRGLTVHGHALRLDENGLMFDARRRYMYDHNLKEVVYVKDMHAKILDEPIPVGRPLTEQELMEMDISYRWDTHQYKSRTEILSVIARIAKFRINAGFKPDMMNGK